VCGREATCLIEGVFVCPRCRVLVMGKFPGALVVEKTTEEWEKKVRAKLEAESTMAGIISAEGDSHVGW